MCTAHAKKLRLYFDNYIIYQIICNLKPLNYFMGITITDTLSVPPDETKPDTLPNTNTPLLSPVYSNVRTLFCLIRQVFLSFTQQTPHRATGCASSSSRQSTQHTDESAALHQAQFFARTPQIFNIRSQQIPRLRCGETGGSVFFLPPLRG